MLLKQTGWRIVVGMLRNAAAAQAKHQGETEPTARFLAILRSSLTSGRAHLAARNGGEPDRAPESCGWRHHNFGKWMSFGDCIGWVDDDDLYLDPTAAYRIAQVAGRDVGEILAVSEQTLILQFFVYQGSLLLESKPIWFFGGLNPTTCGHDC